MGGNAVVLKIADYESMTPGEARQRIKRLEAAQDEDMRKTGRLPDGHAAEIGILEGIAERKERIVVRIAPGAQREPLSIRPQWNDATREWTWTIYSGETPVSEAFRSLADAEGQVRARLPRPKQAGDIIRKFVPQERDVFDLAPLFIKSAEAGGFNFSGVAASERPDRDRDRIKLAGLRTDAFMRNPVLLASHQHSAFPVARATKLAVVGSTLRLDGKFPAAGVSARSDEARALVANGFLRALSVGFRPMSSRPNELGGNDFAEAELLEVSLVSLPSNPDALVDRVW